MSATAPQFICDCSVSYFGWNSLGCKQTKMELCLGKIYNEDNRDIFKNGHNFKIKDVSLKLNDIQD